MFPGIVVVMGAIVAAVSPLSFGLLSDWLGLLVIGCIFALWGSLSEAIVIRFMTGQWPGRPLGEQHDEMETTKPDEPEI